jgi:hypothetical protein
MSLHDCWAGYRGGQQGVQIELGIAIEAIDEPKVAAGLMKLGSLLLGYVGGARIALHDVRA